MDSSVSQDRIKNRITNELLSGVTGSMYTKLLHSLPMAVFACDSHGYLQIYNSAAAQLWGREPLLGQDQWCGSLRIFYPDGQPMPFEDSPMGLTLRQGKPVTGEIIIERPDGQRRNVSSNPMPVFDDQEQLVGGVNILLDITEQKQSAAKAFHLAAIVTSSEDAIVSKTLEGIITSWNDAAERMFGYTAAETIGKHILMLVPADRQMEEPLILDRIRNGERLSYFETKRLTKTGQLIDVTLTISPIKNNNGEIIGASKIVRNTTEEKKIQRKLQEEEERFRMAMAANKMGTWDYSVSVNEFTLSDESMRICGIEAGADVTFEFLIDQVHPADVEDVIASAGKSFTPSGDGHFDVMFRFYRLQDKSMRYLRIQGKVFFDPDAQPERVIGTLLDITEEKNARNKLEDLVKERTAELEMLNEQLQRSNRELEQFAYITSHDLQEPLRKIQTFSGLIYDNPADENIRGQYLPKINKAAAHMSELIRQVLHFSRLSDDQQAFSPVDLNLVIKDVLAEFDLLAEQKGANITCSNLPLVNGIPHQLTQLFRNLVGNSLKFCNDQPQISIEYAEIAATLLENIPAGVNAQRFARIQLRDNGIGFDQQYADKIFLIFKRLNSKDQYAGTGVGLALCKKIVENHGGVITAEGRSGEGAVFTVYLPL